MPINTYTPDFMSGFHFNRYDDEVKALPRMIWECREGTIPFTPVESFLKHTPHYGSNSFGHHDLDAPEFHPQERGMWNPVTQESCSISYSPSCPFGEYTVPAMIVGLNKIGSQEIGAVHIVHIDPNTADFGTLGTMVVGQTDGVVADFSPNGLRGHCVLGIGIGQTLQVITEKNADCGLAVLTPSTLPRLGSLTPDHVKDVTIAIGHNDEDFDAAKTLLNILQSNGLPCAIAITDAHLDKKMTHVKNVSHKEIN